MELTKALTLLKKSGEYILRKADIGYPALRIKFLNDGKDNFIYQINTVSGIVWIDYKGNIPADNWKKRHEPKFKIGCPVRRKLTYNLYYIHTYNETTTQYELSHNPHDTESTLQNIEEWELEGLYIAKDQEEET